VVADLAERTDSSVEEIIEDVLPHLEKDGSMCGYLFQCLHCGKHHLWVDTD